MKTMTFSEIKELDSGDIISAFEGTVKKIYEAKEGDGEYGHWVFQNALLENDEGESIYVTFNDHSDNLKGKRLRLESQLTEKHGKQGLKWDVRKANGKIYSGVKITGQAKITILEEQNEPPGHEDAPANVEKSEAAVAPAQKREDVFYRELMRIANAFHAIKQTMSMEVEQSKVNGIVTPDELFRVQCTSAYMHLRECGALKEMPDDVAIWSVLNQ